MKSPILIMFILLSLVLRGQRVYTYEEALKVNLDSVEALNLSGCGSGYLRLLSLFPNLKVLYAQNMGGEILNIATPLPFLEKIVFSHHQMSYFNLDPTLVPNLKELYINDGNLLELDENCFDGFSELTIIDISRNYLTKLPSSLYNLENLQELNVSFNYDLVLDKDFRSNKLQKFSMAFCYLKEVPKTIENISTLTYLDIGNNFINKISGNLKCKLSLSILKIQYNNFSSLESILQFPSLKHLYASHNNIRKIPKNIYVLMNLKSIDLGFNNISSIANLNLASSNVEYLILRNNKLLDKELTLSVSPVLRHLDLRGNKISKIKFATVVNRNLVVRAKKGTEFLGIPESQLELSEK